MKKLLCILFLFNALLSDAQEEKTCYFEYENKKLIKVLHDVEIIYDVRFSYLDELLKDKVVSIQKDSYTLKELIRVLARTTNLSFERIDARYFAVYKREVSKDFFYANHILNPVIIHAYLTKGITKNKDNSFSILPHKLGILPGLTEPDVLQTLQQLPGVISPNETVTGLHVRGGTPDQNLVLWNGIQMYHSGHLFGMISGFNSNIDQRIHFYNKGTDPIYGGRISSTIAIETSDKIPPKIEIAAGFNMLNFDANVNIPILKNKLKLQVSARRSFTDTYKTFTYKRLSRKVFQHTKIEKDPKDENIFYFRDYNAKLYYQLTKKTSFTLSSIAIENNLNNYYAANEEDHFFNDIMTITNKGYSAKWKTKWTPKFSSSVSAFYSDYFFNYDFVKIDALNSKEIFTKRNKVLDSGLSLDTNLSIMKNTILKLGYQYVAQDVSHVFVSKKPALSIVYDSKAGFVQTHSIYSSLNYSSEKIIALNTGARISYITYLNKFVFEPRFVFNYQVNKHLKASVTGEVKNQSISQIKETIVNDLGVENKLWRVSDNNRFPLLHAKQVTAGISHSISNWTFDIDLYRKNTRGLTTLTYGFLNNLDPNFHEGTSQSYGMDFYMKKDFNNFKIWMTYSFNSGKNKFETLNDNKYFPVNAEIQHTINTATSYKYMDWQFALGWYWHSGKPYTKIWLLESAQTKKIIYGSLNAGRLPDYHRLDISSVWNFSLSKSGLVKGKLGLSVYNLYNRSNILNREYIIDDKNTRLEELDRKSLEINPNLFFRVRF